VRKMFTIEVKKREKDEKFSFEELEMFHQECCSGRIEQEIGSGFGFGEGILTCKRCEESRRVSVAQNMISKIVQTAIDGQERKITEEVCVIQKT